MPNSIAILRLWRTGLPAAVPCHPVWPEQFTKRLDRVGDTIRTLRYSLWTEQAYVQWIKRFIVFHVMRHPPKMGNEEVGLFLTDLAVTRRVNAATQNQALIAILFLYRHALDTDIGGIEKVVRARRPWGLPVVRTVPDVDAILKHLRGSKS